MIMKEIKSATTSKLIEDGVGFGPPPPLGTLPLQLRPCLSIKMFPVLMIKADVFKVTDTSYRFS